MLEIKIEDSATITIKDKGTEKWLDQAGKNQLVRWPGHTTWRILQPYHARHSKHYDTAAEAVKALESDTLTWAPKLYDRPTDYELEMAAIAAITGVWTDEHRCDEYFYDVNGDPGPAKSLVSMTDGHDWLTRCLPEPFDGLWENIYSLAIDNGKGEEVAAAIRSLKVTPISKRIQKGEATTTETFESIKELRKALEENALEIYQVSNGLETLLTQVHRSHPADRSDSHSGEIAFRRVD